MKRKTIVTMICLSLSAGALLVMRMGNPPAAKAQTGCVASSFSGNYGYVLSGVTLRSPQNKQIALGGTFVADGAGNLTMDGIANLGGSIQSQSGTGTYVVNSDCSGHLTVNLVGFLPLTADLFLVNGGQRGLLVQTNTGGVASGEFDKQ